LRFDYLIVGAGYSGSVVAERIASQLDKKVLVIDKRDHVGGNAYDYYDVHGILIHKYGPHIFHTNSKKVWDYLSQFTEWRQYEHHVLGVIEGKKVPIPFNLNSLHMLFSPKEAQIFEGELIKRFGLGAKVPILKLKESADEGLKFLADYIYENVFYGYTLKQWELTPEELSPSVTARVPVYISQDNRYFQDLYQAMPKQGYSKMFENILNHKNIHLVMNTEFRDVDIKEFKKIIFTGPIDEFFDFVHGELPYRSLRFEIGYYEREWYQEVGTVNYPNDYSFTRITEFKHLTGQKQSSTVTATEYPESYKRGGNIPYYPIPRDENTQLLAKYKSEVAKLNGSVLFAGRLADYTYYNMDQAVARALNIFEKEIIKNV
jgi:UDP-galactopyranose mutase